MSFYLRKSVKAGPFRFNLSKSGLGVSAGVKGLRVGAGPRGTYVHIGRRGVYYRQTISPSARGEGNRALGPADFGGVTPSPDLIEDLASVTILEMASSTATDLVQGLNSAARRFPLSPLAWLTGKHRAPVMYDVTDAPARAFDAFVTAFEDLQRTRGRWLIDARGDLQTDYQRKVNAGASSLIRRQPISTVVQGPKWLVTNIAVPGFVTKGLSVYFLPDQVLVQSGKRFASWKYGDLKVSLARTRFIEEESVPSDATQVGQTWKYVNKRGGPDRRFKDNRILPIMEYAELEVAGQGVTVRIQLSNVTAAEAFVSKLATIPSVDPGDNDLILTKPAVPEHIVSEKDINSADGPDRRRSPAGTMPDVTLAEAEDARTTRGSRADLPPANWYRDPTGNAQWRWWDGQKWTEHIA